MAYVYDEIQNQLKQPGALKTDIFSGDGGGQVTPDGGQIKTEIGPGGQREISGAGTRNTKIDNSNSGQIRAFRAAQEKVKTPTAFADITNTIRQGRATIDSQKQAYEDKLRKRDFSVSDQEIENAISGQSDAEKAITGRLSGAVTAPEAEEFKTEQKNVSDRYLATPEGIGTYYRDISGPQYTAGERSFDVMSSIRDPEIQVARDRALKEQRGFGDILRSISGDTTSLGNQILQESYKRGTQGLRSSLGSKTDAMRQDLAEKERKIEAERQAALDDPTGYAASQSQGILKSLEDTLAGSMTAPWQQERLETSRRLLQNIGIDPNQFVQPGEVDIDPNSIINQDYANRYNKILGFLGQGDLVTAATQGPGDVLGYNAAGYGSELNKIYNDARRAEDERLRNQRADVMKGLPDRAALAQNEWNNPEYQQRILDELINETGNLGYMGPAHNVNINRFVDFLPGQVSPEDVMTQEEADLLNNVMRELGEQGNEFSAGSGGSESTYNFDRGGYEQAIRDFYKGGAGAVSVPGSAAIDTSGQVPSPLPSAPEGGWFPNSAPMEEYMQGGNQIPSNWNSWADITGIENNQPTSHSNGPNPYRDALKYIIEGTNPTIPDPNYVQKAITRGLF